MMPDSGEVPVAVLGGPRTQRYEIKRLLPRHFRILELVLAGHGRKQIAEVLGMSEAGVGLIISSPLFQHEVASRRDGRGRDIDQGTVESDVRRASSARDVLERASLQAAETQVSLLEADDPRVQLASANAILDRVMEKKSDKTAALMLTTAAIELLQRAMQESRESRDARDANV